MADQDWKNHGLNLNKYFIGKTCTTCYGSGCGASYPGLCLDCDGKGFVPVDPQAAYFVLRIDCNQETGEANDPNARAALLEYARCIRPLNSQFADDIEKWLSDFSAAAPAV